MGPVVSCEYVFYASWTSCAAHWDRVAFMLLERLQKRMGCMKSSVCSRLCNPSFSVPTRTLFCISPLPSPVPTQESNHAQARTIGIDVCDGTHLSIR
jgi:hypothetical protein